MNKANNKKALSLVEILISAVLLSLVVGGIVSVFLAARRYVLHANERSVASGLSSSYLKSFASEVRQDTWNTGRIKVGSSESLNWDDIDGKDYEGPSKVESTGHDYRKVTVTVEYPD